MQSDSETKTINVTKKTPGRPLGHRIPKVTIMSQVPPEAKEKILALAAQEERSVSWMAGRL